MAKKISQPIVDYQVVSTGNDKLEPEQVPEKPKEADIIHMHEKVDRPEMLLGSTYKIKTPLTEHAMYVTINDIVLNPGTDHELRRPFEMFINSKNMDQFQWILALTRVASAVFRKGGDITFLVEELKAVFDPKGGYFKKGGVFMSSVVAEIGHALESHLRMIGMLKTEELSDHQKQIMEEKRKQFEDQSKVADAAASDDENPYPDGAQLCNKCHTKASIMLDGCMTCLSCGDSKCG